MSHRLAPRTTPLVSLLFLLSACAPALHEVRLGDQFRSEGNWEAALFIYQEGLKRNPDDKRLQERLTEAKRRGADAHLKKGKELLGEHQVAPAAEVLQRAMVLDPARPEIAFAFAEALRLKEAGDRLAAGKKLMDLGRMDEAIEEFERAFALDPSLSEAQKGIAEARSRKAVAPADEELTLRSEQPITLKFQNARLNEVFDLLARTSGINILFDKDLRPETINVTIFIKNASFKDALSLILATNNLFMKKIREDTILIIPKTQPKVNQYQDLLIRTFYLSEVKAEDMVNLLRTMLETRRIFINKELNAIVVRDTPDKIRLAEKIIGANDRKRAEVMLAVELLEVSRDDRLRYGWNFVFGNNQALQGTAGIGSTGPGQTLSLDALRSLSETNIFVTLPTLFIELVKLESNAQTLANPRVRVLDGSSAKINIGDKVPIKLSQTTSTATTATTTGGTSTTTSTEFKDVGINLNVEPRISLTNDVTLKVTLEVTTQGEFVPQADQFKFGNRRAETVLHVKDGETVVIGGLIRDEERVSLNKVPGLGDIPILGKLFSHTDKQKVKSDILLTISPRVVRSQEMPDESSRAFWSGTEDTYSVRPLFSEIPTEASVSPGMPPSLPPAPFQPVPPQSPTPPFGPPPPPSRLPLPGPVLPAPRTGALIEAVPGPLISFAEGETAEGQEVRVVARLRQVSDSPGASLAVDFDPEVLAFSRAIEGGFYRKAGGDTTFAASSPTPGTVQVRVRRGTPVSGEGDLVTLVFRGRRKGNSPIVLQEGTVEAADGMTWSLPAAVGRVVVR